MKSHKKVQSVLESFDHSLVRKVPQVGILTAWLQGKMMVLMLFS